MIGGVNSSMYGSSAVSTSVGTSRYWYGLPQWPAGQNAYRRQFDAGQYLNTLFLGGGDSQSLVDPSGYVNSQTLSGLKDLFTPIALREGDPIDIAAELLNSRVWPTQWPANVPQSQPTTTDLTGGADLVGQILNILA